MAELRLGPFVLQTPLARGGMAEVWSGLHRGSGARVAVKLLPRGSDDRAGRAAFEREVRAVAALDHPGIVHVLDQGRVDDTLQHATRGRLRVGAPWMVMEHASGGTLARIGALTDWRTTRAVLLSLLDALAHAHARGLVHRDLKPGNVLLCSGADDRPGLKLTDFGIAHAVGMNPAEASRAGTLPYMAPEQIRGAIREVGPWTDLYALGCTTWSLLTGAPPFAGLDGAALQRAHLEQVPPPIAPGLAVPPGLAAWVACLLAKDPADRFKRAAEAAAALLALDPAAAESPSEGSARGPTPATLVRQIDGMARPDLVICGPTTLAVDGVAGLAGSRAAWRPTALRPTGGQALAPPSTWRHPVPRPPSARLRGAGLGLLGLREHRLVGRDRALDQGWAALCRVADTGACEVLVVRGHAGVGRSRLALALAERAHELGVADVFVAQHELAVPPGTGLQRMIRRASGTEGLERSKVWDWCDAVLGVGRDADVLTELLAPASAQDVAAGAAPPSAGPEELSGVLVRTVRALAGDRVALVVLDDAHCDPSALAWAGALIRRTDLAAERILALVTVREDGVGEGTAADALRRLETGPRTTSLTLEALPRGAMHDLVRGLLGLESSAASRLIDRAAGNPQFAEAVVREWAERGLLAMGEHGFALAEGAEVRLPVGLVEAWEARAREAMAELPEGAWSGLVRAAVLGNRVDDAVWRASCAEAEEMVLTAIVEELVARGLAEEDPGGWRFGHAPLREALVESAAPEALEAHHLACASALRARGVSQDDAQIGWHLLRAGALNEALDPLLRAATGPGDQYRGLEVAALAEEALSRSGKSFGDPRWGRVWARRAGLCMRAGRYGEAERWAVQAAQHAVARGWTDVALDAALERATIALHTHKPEGQALADAAWDQAVRDGSRRQQGRALYLRANAAAEVQDWDEAVRLHLEVVALCREIGDGPGEADSLRDLGNVALLCGRLDEAAARYAAAGVIFAGNQAFLGLAHVHNGLGDIARKQGDLDAAEAAYLEALDAFDRVGSGQAMLARLNLGLVLIAKGRWARARELLEGTRTWLVEQDRAIWVAVAGVCLLPVYAALRDWEAWDRTAVPAERVLGSTGFAQPDVLGCARKAEALCRAAGKEDRADVAQRIGSVQAERLGLP